MKGLSLKLGIIALNLVLTGLLSSVCAEDDYPGALQRDQELMSLTADRIKIESGRHGMEFVYDGKVKVKQGNVTLSCDRLVIIKEAKTSAESKGEKPATRPIKSITASGNVKITQNKRRATAEKAVWDHAKQTVTLTGGPPRLWQGRDSFSGHRIIMRLDENYAAIDYGGAPDPRPRPQKKEK